MAESEVTAGEQILPLINHLARVGRRAAECTPGCLRPRLVIALKLLGERGPMAQHAFGEALSLDPSNVVGLLNELEEQGLVVRQRDPADRRRHIVELSATGSRELAAANSQLRLVEDDLLKALSAEERATLYRLLVRAAGVTAPRLDSACAADERPTGSDAPGAPPSCLG